MNKQLIYLPDEQLIALINASEDVGYHNKSFCEHPGLEHATSCGFTPVTPIGRGGMAEVWRGIDGNTGREVAIKVAHKDSSAAIEVLGREADVLSQLAPPNVAALIRQGGEAETRFLVLEFIEGLSFTEYLHSNQLSLAEIIKLMCRVCEAVANVHSAGFLHGDIKPSNVIVRQDGSPLLIDFGLSSTLNNEHFPIMRRTFYGGTPRYLAPELKTHQHVTAHVSSDIYSLGMTFDHIVDLADIRVPDGLHQVIHKACAESPDCRHTSVTDFANSIVACNSIPITVKHGRFRLTPAALLVVASIGLAIFLMLFLAGRIQQRISFAGPDTTSNPIPFVAKQLRVGHVSDATKALLTIPVTQRGWEWHHLWSEAAMPPSVRRLRFRNAGTTVAIGNDGLSFAVADNMGVIYRYQIDGTFSILSEVDDLPTHVSTSPNGFVAVYQSGRVARMLGDAGNISSEIFKIGRPKLCWPSSEIDNTFVFDSSGKAIWQINIEKSKAIKIAAADYVLNACSSLGWALLVNETDRKGEIDIIIADQVLTPRIRDTFENGEMPLAFDIDSNKSIAVVGTTFGRVRIYNVTEPGPARMCDLDITDKAISSILVDSEENRIFLAADRLYILDFPKGRRLLELPIGVPGISRSIRWNRQARTLSLVTNRGAVIWNAPVMSDAKLALH